ncbi:MAG: hypothetical protein GW809_09720, partial [Bacteroidetes bacterium]|nr:hypothetical protein [Bacteroidota bacterium]
QKDEINKRLEESELDPTQWIDWEDVSINL